MDSVLLKEEWEYNSLTKMFSGDDEEADCMLHFMQNFGTPSDFLSTGEATRNVAVFEEDALFYSSENANSNFYLSQDITDSRTSATNFSTGSVGFPNYFSNISYLTPEMMNEMMPHEFVAHDGRDYNMNALGDVVQDNAMCLKEEIADGRSTDLVSIKRKFEDPELSEAVKENRVNAAASSDQNPKKKTRVPRDVSTTL